MSDVDEQEQQAWDIVRGFKGGKDVSFNTEYARRLGGKDAAIFLDYLLRWSGQEHKEVFRTQDQIEEDTTLTRSQQDQARARLVSLGILTAKRKGVPARLYYQVSAKALLDALASRIQDCKDSTIQIVKIPQSRVSHSYNHLNEVNVETTTVKEIGVVPNGTYSTRVREKTGAHSYTPEFETWWSIWPKKGDTKYAAFKTWRNLTKQHQAAARDGLPKWLPYYASIENRLIPNATTWLNQRRWEGEPPPAESKSAAKSKIPDRIAMLAAEWDKQHGVSNE